MNSAFKIVEFHIQSSFAMYTDLEERERRLVSHEEMHNMSNNNKTMYFVHFSEAHVQTYAELPRRLVFHNHLYGGLQVMMGFIATPSRSARTYTRRACQPCTVL
jgi:hypothetical protein